MILSLLLVLIIVRMSSILDHDYPVLNFCAVDSNSVCMNHDNENSTNQIRHVLYVECVSLDISLIPDDSSARKNQNTLTLMNDIGLEQNGIYFICQ